MKHDGREPSFDLSRLRQPAELKAYQDWKQHVPSAVRSLVESAMLGRAKAPKAIGLPRVDGFLQAIAQRLSGVSTMEASDYSNLVSALSDIETPQGTGDGLTLLADKNVSFSTKLGIWQNYLAPMLNWLKDQDLAPPEQIEPELPKKPEESKKDLQEDGADDVPPPPGGEIAPTMDEMEKGEGEPHALYRLTPFYGGYHAEERCDVWDAASLSWKRSITKSEPLIKSGVDALAARKLKGKLRAGQPLVIPLAKGWIVDPESLDLPEGVQSNFQRLADGTVFLKTEAEGVFEYEMTVGPAVSRLPDAPPEQRDRPAERPRLPNELKSQISEIAESAVSADVKARLIIKTVRERLEYSNDSSFNAKYRQDTAGYVERVWEGKKADCDVANTVAFFALQEAGIAARIVGGHYVKSKSKDGSTALTTGGSAVMHGGTRHAWLEVRDEQTGQWFTADATPKGDPTLDEERPDEQSESGEGDYGEQEAEIMSDEELQELIESLSKDEAGPLKKTGEEREIEKFAELAGCPPDKAREVRSAFARLRELRDRKGELIGAKLVKAWKDVVHSHLKSMRVYTGPVRRSEGDELDDPVAKKLEQRAGEKDPTGYETAKTIEKHEKVFGGLDVYLMLDLSESMNETHQGRKKCDLQRDFGMLYLDSLMQCALMSRRASGRLTSDLPMRVEVVSIHGGVSIDLPLTAQWTPKEQVALYDAVMQAAGGGTPDDAGLKIIESHVLKQREAWKNKSHKPHEQPPLEFVAVSLDGGSNDPTSVRAVLKRMRSAGTVVYGYGMTAAARPIEAIYAPDVKVTDDLSALPALLADDTLSVFKKLYPQRVKKRK